jgi:hypothetical protein
MGNVVRFDQLDMLSVSACKWYTKVLRLAIRPDLRRSVGALLAHANDVDYCLIGPQGNNQDRCGLHYSVDILGIVCGCALVVCLLILWTWWQHRQFSSTHEEKAAKRTMITIGDAIQNYLGYPDPAWMYLRNFQVSNGRRSSRNEVITISEVTWLRENRVRWGRAVSTFGWVTSLLL